MACSLVPKVGGAAAPSAPPVPTPMSLKSGHEFSANVSKVWAYKLYAMSLSIFLPHIDRFAKFFHCQT